MTGNYNIFTFGINMKINEHNHKKSQGKYNEKICGIREAINKKTHKRIQESCDK